MQGTYVISVTWRRGGTFRATIVLNNRNQVFQNRNLYGTWVDAIGLSFRENFTNVYRGVPSGDGFHGFCANINDDTGVWRMVRVVDGEDARADDAGSLGGGEPE